MRYLICHQRPEIGVFVGAMPEGRLVWTGVEPDVIAALTFESQEQAQHVAKNIDAMIYSRCFVLPCVPDVMDDLGEWRFASPCAVVDAAGRDYGWLNERTVCYGCA